MKEHNNELFVGYVKEMPAGMASFLKVRVIGVLVAVPMIAIALTATQRAFDKSRFEFGTLKSFEGIVQSHPYPTLMLAQPGKDGQGTLRSRIYLVAPGKHGAADVLGDADGHRVRLEGTLIYRENQTMVEVAPGSVERMEEAGAPEQAVALGAFTLRGEIVDSKCYLGVMKPGHLKPHRSCAIRCISGGIPPVFLVRDDQGTATYLMLVSADGRAVNEDVLEMVAVPLEITGHVERRDNLLVLKADPATYQRI